jgi:hypothetical protein
MLDVAVEREVGSGWRLARWWWWWWCTSPMPRVALHTPRSSSLPLRVTSAACHASRA